MRKDYEKLFTHLKPAEPPAGLFDKIVLAIEREQQLQRAKWIVFGFLGLMITSIGAAPFSWSMLAGQIESSGVLYFLSTVTSDAALFLALWKDAGLAILESLPIIGITIFAINMSLILFTIRLFLHRRRLLIGYIIQSI